LVSAVYYAAPAAWNTLPPPLQQLTNTDSFKRQLKTVFFERAFSYFRLLTSFYTLLYPVNFVSFLFYSLFTIVNHWSLFL